MNERIIAAQLRSMLPPALLGIAVPLITFIVLMAVGSGLTAPEFRRVWSRPRLVLAGLVVPPVVLPGVAMALLAWLHPPPHIASGLLLIAICPVGGISNTFTYLARGSTALSVTLTACSCALAVLTIPGVATLVRHVTAGPAVVHVPLALLLGQLLAAVVLPVGIGMLVRFRVPHLASACQPALQRTGFTLLALLLAMIILADVRGFLASLGEAVPVAALFIAGAMIVGGGVGHAVGGDLRERIALAIEFSTRNVAVASTLALTMGRIEFATFATTYFLTELPVMTIATLVFRALVARSQSVGRLRGRRAA